MWINWEMGDVYLFRQPPLRREQVFHIRPRGEPDRGVRRKRRRDKRARLRGHVAAVFDGWRGDAADIFSFRLRRGSGRRRRVRGLRAEFNGHNGRKRLDSFIPWPAGRLFRVSQETVETYSFLQYTICRVGYSFVDVGKSRSSEWS